ncbi:kinase [Pseudalkalibacillus sp. NRS-1564]|uniref:kinase n=1 Tax=Pseudalkalibacillus sp. NRS-1564 TaxID=3233900 RepID=UPI003D2CE9F3
MTHFDLEMILPKPPLKEPFLLGIDGLSRSGKTTFVSELEHLLEMSGYRSVTFHIDDYIEPKEKRYNTGHEEWYEYYFLQWDVAKLKQQLFDSIMERIPPENLKVDLVLIEGVFLQRDEWRSAFDCVLFLQCERDVRFGREKEETQRNLKKFEERYWKAEKYYMDTVKPLERADFVVES